MYAHARRLIFSVSLAVAAATVGVHSTASAQPSYQRPNSEPRYAAIVVDAKSGEVLYAKRADSPRYPASITKVMTLYLTFEALQAGKIDLDDPVVFSPRAAAQAPTKLGVRAGDSITVDQAMKALAVKSANDVAVALAEKLGGTESRFAALMTLRAKELGMHGTHFANASGLPDSRQISTARDIAILSRAVMRDYPQYYSLFSTRQFTFRGQTMGNHNRLLGKMPGVDGLKTGFTNASGFNLAASAVQDGRRLIAVVLGGPSSAARDNNAEDLLLTGFSVMRRRALGEQITIAQNLFEPEPTGPLVRPPVEQGDSEQDGLKIVLAANTAEPRLSKASPPPAAAAKKKPEADKKADAKKGKGKWSVQVGAFKSMSLARKQVTYVEDRFEKHFAKADGVAEKNGKTYRARFSGFTEASAKSACGAMKAKRLDCRVIEPS